MLDQSVSWTDWKWRKEYSGQYCILIRIMERTETKPRIFAIRDFVLKFIFLPFHLKIKAAAGFCIRPHLSVGNGNVLRMR